MTERSIKEGNIKKKDKETGQSWQFLMSDTSNIRYIEVNLWSDTSTRSFLPIYMFSYYIHT